MVVMRTAEECLTKAADMERMAARCEAPAMIADYLYMAKCWRRAASQAAWQDISGHGAQ